MDYWLVAGNGCNTMCTSTDVSLMVHWLGGPCVMYHWKYGQNGTVNVPVSVSSNTPLHDTWSSGSKEAGWGVNRMEIVWSDSVDLQLGDA